MVVTDRAGTFKHIIDNKLLWYECIIKSADENMTRVYPGSKEFSDLFKILENAVKEHDRYLAAKDAFIKFSNANLSSEDLREKMRLYLKLNGLDDLMYLFNDDLEDF